MLGLTINCARCHSHKFDPLSQTDYYRLSAVFKDAWDEHDWLKPLDERLLPHVTAVERAGWLQQKQSLEQQIEQLQQRRESADESVRRELDGQITALQKQIPAEPRIRALWSRGRPSPTWVLLRGDYLKPGRRVQPGVPEVLEPAAVVSAAVAGGSQDRCSSGICSLADQTGSSVDGQSDGESDLDASFWTWTGGDSGQFWPCRCAAIAS